MGNIDVETPTSDPLLCVHSKTCELCQLPIHPPHPTLPATLSSSLSLVLSHILAKASFTVYVTESK